MNPVLAGILQRSTGAPLEKGAKIAAASAPSQASRPSVSSSSSQQEVARAAVGKGVRHGFMASSSTGATDALASASMIFPDPPNLGFPAVEDSLSELTNNYRNSLQSAVSSMHNQQDESGSSEESKEQRDPSFQMYNFLSRDSSLVDLAMLVPATNADTTAAETDAEPPESDVDPTPVNELGNSSMPLLDFSGMDQAPAAKDESG